MGRIGLSHFQQKLSKPDLVWKPPEAINAQMDEVVGDPEEAMLGGGRGEVTLTLLGSPHPSLWQLLHCREVAPASQSWLRGSWREEGEREEGEKEEGKREEGEREGGKREGGRRKERGGRGRKGKGSRPRSARAPPDMTVSKLEFGLNLVSETGSQPPVSSHPGLIHLMGWVEIT